MEKGQSYFKRFILSEVTPLIYFALCFVIALSALLFYFKLEENRSLFSRVTSLREKVLRERLYAKELKEKEIAAAKEDPFYLEKHLESLIFLEKETKTLESRAPTLGSDPEFKKRIHFLKEENRLRFVYSSSEHSEEWKLQRAVEVNEEDLRKVLLLLEGKNGPPGRPPFTIKEFTLTKKALSPSEKIYLLNFELMKRKKI